MIIVVYQRFAVSKSLLLLARHGNVPLGARRRRQRRHGLGDSGHGLIGKCTPWPLFCGAVVVKSGEPISGNYGGQDSNPRREEIRRNRGLVVLRLRAECDLKSYSSNVPVSLRRLVSVELRDFLALAASASFFHSDVTLPWIERQQLKKSSRGVLFFGRLLVPIGVCIENECRRFACSRWDKWWI